jgi:hypothetical protein
MAEELEEALRTNAAGPRRARGDSSEIEQHPLGDQIAADRYLASKNAAKNKGLGIRFRKLTPPGTD